MWRAVLSGRLLRAGRAGVVLCAVMLLVGSAAGAPRGAAAQSAADDRYVSPSNRAAGREATPARRAVTGNVPRSRAKAAVRVPDQALLKLPAEPDCEYKPATAAATTPGAPAASDPAEAQRVKLDYERQCYRHAALIARDKLRQVQAALAASVKATGR